MVFLVAGGFAGLFVVLFLAGAGIILYYNSTLPDYNDLVSKQNSVESSKIYSRDGTLLYEFHGEVKRTAVDLSQISDYLQKATVAVEDKDFYKHGPISIVGIGRAIMSNYKSGTITQGGSTITQQFVKQAYLSSERSYSRKLTEVLLAYKIESHLSKNQILNLYLNQIPYGRNAYGAEAAGEAYFGKSARDLTLAESAYLAALPQAPSFYNPTGPNVEALDDRKNLVLQLMQQQGYITGEQMTQAQNETVTFKDVRTTIIAPYFVSWIQNYLTDKYGRQFLEEGGLKVYTTLDLHLQSLAEQAVKDGAAINDKKYGAANAALVAIEPSSGKVLAMAGGKDYFAAPEPKGCTPGVNCTFAPNVNAATAQRQPGSSFKPYVYLTAFGPQFAYNPTSYLVDEPTTFGTANGRPYTPRNYDGGYHGRVTMRQALGGSLNIPAVKTLSLVGVDNAVKTAHSLGITSPLENCGLSLVLGGCEVRLVDHVAAFASIANGGKANLATPFLRIEDKNGKVLEEYHAGNEQVVDPQAVYELISILTDNNARTFIFGKNTPLTLSDRVVAAKTGTTNEWHDGWTIGFTPQLAAGVWTGNDNNAALHAGADGVFVASPIWHKFMAAALKDLPPADFPVPPGVVQVKYNIGGNSPATKNARSTRTEAFASYSLPKEIQQLAAPRSALNNWLKLKPAADATSIPNPDSNSTGGPSSNVPPTPSLEPLPDNANFDAAGPVQ